MEDPLVRSELTLALLLSAIPALATTQCSSCNSLLNRSNFAADDASVRDQLAAHSANTQTHRRNPQNLDHKTILSSTSADSFMFVVCCFTLRLHLGIVLFLRIFL